MYFYAGHPVSLWYVLYLTTSLSYFSYKTKFISSLWWFLEPSLCQGWIIVLDLSKKFDDCGSAGILPVRKVRDSSVWVMLHWVQRLVFYGRCWLWCTVYVPDRCGVNPRWYDAVCVNAHSLHIFCRYDIIPCLLSEVWHNRCTLFQMETEKQWLGLEVIISKHIKNKFNYMCTWYLGLLVIKPT